MSEKKRLLPVTEFKAKELGRQVHELLKDGYMRKTLVSRHLIGVVKRHSGDWEDSVASMERAQKIHSAGEMAIMAVLSDNGKVVGMATADPSLQLRRIYRFAHKLPPVRLQWPLAKKVKGVSPNIAAWTVEVLVPRESPKLLEDAYRELIKLIGPAFEVFSGGSYYNLELLERMRCSRSFNPWTIEPGAQNSPVHLALQRAGLEIQDIGWLDDNEDRNNAVPVSTLYTLKDPLTVPS